MQISIRKEHENTRLNVQSQKKSKTKIEKKFVNPFRITNPDKEQIEQEYYSHIWDIDKKSEYGDILGGKYQHKMPNGSEIRAHNHAFDINKSAFGNFRNSVHEKTGRFFQLPLSQKKL